MTSIIPIRPFGKDLKDIVHQDIDSSDVVSVSGSPVPVGTSGVSGSVNPGDSFVRGGVTFSRSSKKDLNVLEAIIYAKDCGMVLQSVDQAVYARVMLDKDPLVGVGGERDVDFSDKYQLTSSFATYGMDGDGRVWVGVWDLESIFGGDLDRHVAVVSQLSKDKITEKSDPLTNVILDFVNRSGRVMDLPSVCSPYVVDVNVYGSDSVIVKFLPLCAVLNAAYLKSKKCSSGKMYFLDSSDLAYLKGTGSCETRPLRLGGGDYDDINGVSAYGNFGNVGRSRGVAVGAKFLGRSP